MKLSTPADGPPWLRRFADSIVAGLKSQLSAPFWLWGETTANLPTTSDLGANKGAIAFDLTGNRPAYFDGSAWKQLEPYDATLTALAALPGTLGLVEQTSADVFGIRLIGVANASDVLTRAGGDGRYAAIGSGVTSFNTRTGAVTLISGDVTTALGFTPYNSTNPSGYISGITSGMVTSALGYTPTSVVGLTGSQTVAAFKTGLSLVKADVGLGSVDNTADAAKAVLSATKWTTARNLAGNSVDGAAAVAFANKFIVQGTTDTGLSGAQFLGALATGIVKNTTTTGVLSIAVAADFPTLNQSTTGSAATLTTGRTIGISGAVTGTATSFNGSANITIPITALDVGAATVGTLVVARGGTGGTDAATASTNLGLGTANSPRFASIGLGAAAIANTGIYATAAVNGVYKLLFENTSNGASAFASMQWKNDAGNIGVIFMNSSGNAAYAGANSLLLNNSSNNPLAFATNDTVRWSISAAGHFLAFADNTYDIGASGATRPRNIYVAGVVVTGSYAVAGLPAAGTAGAGATAFVTDATATTFASTVAGGGANKVPVYSDGTNWKIG